MSFNQVSPVVAGFPSSHIEPFEYTLEIPPWHISFNHVSLCVEGFPSSHNVPLVWRRELAKIISSWGGFRVLVKTWLTIVVLFAFAALPYSNTKVLKAVLFVGITPLNWSKT